MIAQICTWTAGDIQDPYNWSNPKNWNLNRVPNFNDEVEIESFPRPLAYPVVNNNDTVNVGSLYIETEAELTVKGVLKINGNLYLEGSKYWGSKINLMGEIHFEKQKQFEGDNVYGKMYVHENAIVQLGEELIRGDTIILRSSDLFKQDGDPMNLSHFEQREESMNYSVGYIGDPNIFRMINLLTGVTYNANFESLNKNRLGYSFAMNLEVSPYSATQRKVNSLSFYSSLDIFISKDVTNEDSVVNFQYLSGYILFAMDQKKYENSFFTTNLIAGLNYGYRANFDPVFGLRFILTSLTYHRLESFLDIKVMPFAGNENKSVILEGLIALPVPLNLFTVKLFAEYRYGSADGSNLSDYLFRKRISVGVGLYASFTTNKF